MELGRIPNNLKMFRHSNGYSRKKVARVLRLADTSNISRWERGIKIPNMKIVFELAKMYNTCPHELYPDLWNTLEPEQTKK